MTKKCFKCGVEKPIEEFYKHPQMADGHLGKCKACTKNDVSTNYRENVEHYVQYEQKRSKTQKRKLSALDYQRKRRQNHPDKYKARLAISNAIRDGKLKPQLCEICGETAEAHHDDYSKPFDVRWLCFKHHLEVHGKTAHLLSQDQSTFFNELI